MITKEDLGRMLFNNEKVTQLLKERDEALAKAEAYHNGWAKSLCEYDVKVNGKCESAKFYIEATAMEAQRILQDKKQ